MRYRAGWIIVVWIVLTVFTTAVQAHEMEMTGVKVRLDGGSVSVSVVAHLHNVGAANPITEISRRLKLRLDGNPFHPEGIRLSHDKANGIVMWQAQSPVTASRVEVEAPLFPEKSDETTVITVFKDRQLLGEAVLDARHPSAIISAAPKSAVSLQDKPVNSGLNSVVSRFVAGSFVPLILATIAVAGVFLITQRLVFAQQGWRK